MLFQKKTINSITFFSFILITIIFFFFLIKDKPLFFDESQYYSTIEQVTSLSIKPDIFQSTLTLPGYVFLIGILRYILGISTIADTRLLTTILSVFSIFIFYLCAKEINPKTSKIKTLQYLFFPILFVFFFLIYTDVFSLFLLLSSFYLLLKGRYNLSGLTGFLSLLVRQSNIIWIAFFFIYLFFEKYKFKINYRNIIDFLKDTIVYSFSFVAVIIFFIVNKGFTVGSYSKLVQPVALHTGNIYFFLLLFFFLFLPLNIKNFPKIVKLIIKKPLIIAFICIVFLLYLLTFKVDHIWNSPPLNFFLRNKFLNYMVEDNIRKMIFFIPMAYSALSICTITLHKRIHYLIFLISALLLSLSWLIEQRYLLVPFVLFLLFKKEDNIFIEKITIVIYFFLAIFFFLGIINGEFFL